MITKPDAKQATSRATNDRSSHEACVDISRQQVVLFRCHRAPAVSAHSLLPICTSREQHRANANTSSSPVNIELAPTISADKPCRISNALARLLKHTFGQNVRQERDVQGHPSHSAYATRSRALLATGRPRTPCRWAPLT